MAAYESRNIVLRGSHVVHGALFCMVVKAPWSTLLPITASTDASSGGATAASDVSGSSFTVDTEVPAGLSVRTCQDLFRALCAKAQLVCKSFQSLKKLAEVKTLVVHLTPELLGKGTLSEFCKAVTAAGAGKGSTGQGRHVLLVDCGCAPAALEALQRSLSDALFVDFSVAAPMPAEEVAAPESDEGAERSTSTGVPIDVAMCVGPLAAYEVSKEAAVRIGSIMAALSTGTQTGAVVVVTGISQELLLHLASRIADSPQGPLLYGMCDFFFPRCLAYLSRPAPGHSVTRCTHVSTSESTRCTSRAAASPSPGEEKLVGASNSLTNSIDVPCVAVAEALNPHIFLSVNSMGVVSERADCVLLEANLARLARAFEIVDQQIASRVARV